MKTGTYIIWKKNDDFGKIFDIFWLQANLRCVAAWQKCARKRKWRLNCFANNLVIGPLLCTFFMHCIIMFLFKQTFLQSITYTIDIYLLIRLKLIGTSGTHRLIYVERSEITTINVMKCKKICMILIWSKKPLTITWKLSCYKLLW